MLTSIVLLLTSTKDAVLPSYNGRANYAETLRLLGHMDPGLNDAIHDHEGVKPLTCSVILGGRVQRDLRYLAAGEACWLRVAGLNERVSQALLNAFYAHPPATWRVHDQSFAVVASLCDPTRHPWSGQISYEELASRYLLAGIPLAQLRRVTLEFVTPTTFKSKEMQMPLPLPNLVYGSLVDRWNQFSPVTLDPAMRALGEQGIAISRFTLHSELVEQKNAGLRAGAIGEITYNALVEDRYWLSVFQMLSDFALFSGVGAQTSVGMGMVRRR